MDTFFYLLNAVGIVIILLAWFKIIRLKRRIPGGVVKATCNVMSQFIGIFAIGLLALPLFRELPEFSREALINIELISAGVFTVIVVNFFNDLASDSGF